MTSTELFEHQDRRLFTAGSTAPEKVKPVDRKKPQYRTKRACYCCGGVRTGPHHKIPRAEGGLPIFDNIVWLCVECHDAVEGPSVGFRDRLEQRRYDCKEAQHPQPIAEATPEQPPHCAEKDDPPLLVELQRKRMSQGYLEPHDAKRYQFMLADLGRWDKLSTWCLWNHQELHAEALARRMTGARISSALQHVIDNMPRVLYDPAKYDATTVN
jgi:hypothetical protein